MPHISAHRHILLVSGNTDTHRVFCKALSVSRGAADPNKTLPMDENLPDSQWPLPPFTLVCMKSMHSVLEKLAEAQRTGHPISLIFIEVSSGEWGMVRDLVEQMWKKDEAIRCVFCLPPDETSWPQRMIFSRPEQWAVLRLPLPDREIAQWANCLSVRVPSPLDPVSNGSGLPAEIQLCHSDSPLLDWEEKAGVVEPTREGLTASGFYVDNILRSMADTLLVINADMTIGAVNPSLLQLLGYQEHELIGASPGLIFGEEFAHGIILENLLLQGSVSGVESTFLTHDGRKIPISVSGSMMQNQQGQFQGLVCVAQDITERKRMEEEKRQLHEQLLDTSRQLGMAEVATGVLHNVGNVLNSMNVSIGVIADLLKKSLVVDVGRISQLLERHRDDLGIFLSQNPKGKQVPGYLEQLSRQLVEEKRVALLELDRLRDNAGHAQQCVAAQQDLAKLHEIKEPVSLVELADEALAVNQTALEESQIEVIREFQEMPQVILDKHRVLQILVDVIRNASEAMESVLLKQLILRVKLIIGPPDSICLEVQDTGKGILPEDLTKIFGQGYNTTNGRRGLNLHRGALMAKNMGGTFRAKSEGAGKGATFSLDLPGDFYFPST